MKSIGGSVTGIGRPDIALKIVSISATTNVVLNFLLIPTYGIVGAAVATTVSLFVASLVGIFITVRMLNVEIDLKWYAKISGMTLFFILVFEYYEHVNLYLLGMPLLCIYSLVIFTNFLTAEDRDYFMELIRKG